MGRAPLEHLMRVAATHGGLDLRFEGAVVEDVRHPKLKELIALWRSRFEGDRPPPRSSLSMRDLKAFLAHMAIAAPVPGADDFYFRYAGSSLEQRLGVTLQRRTLREAFVQPAVDDFVERYSSVARTLRPFFRRGRYSGAASEVIDYELGLLPLIGPQDGETWVLAAQFAFPNGRA